MRSFPIQIAMILIIFVFAGINKIFSMGSTSKGLMEVTGLSFLPIQLFQLAIIIVIILEICAPFIVIGGEYNLYEKIYSRVAIQSLIGFTILATILYHPPTSQANMIPFLKNLGLLGAMWLIYDNIGRK